MSNFNLQVLQFKDYGPAMWAGRSAYHFEVAVASHDEMKGGQRHTARVTQVSIPRVTGEPMEYWEAKDTAALMAAGHHKGMPIRVNPLYKEDTR